MRTRLALSLFLSLLAAWPHAFSQGVTPYSSPQGTQDQNQNIDCSNPLNAALCGTNQSQQPGLPLGNYGQIGTYGTGESNVPFGAPLSTRTYTDLGTNLTNLRNQPTTAQQPGWPAAAEPLSEFQKFVAATTAEVLPIFGANLFRNVPSTFAPVEQIPVTPDYVIGPGDELRIRVWGQINFNADVLVDRSGSVYIPQVGAIHVAGLQFSALQQHLRSEIGRVYRNFDLTVDAGQLRSIQVFVVGQARRSGTYTVSSLSTLVNALFASGGPSPQGSLRHILLKRQGKTITDFDLYDLLVNGDKSKDTQLLPGDVIFIPPAGPQVALTGSVRRPAVYELRDTSTTLEQVLAYAGGPSSIASGSRISIDRTVDDRQARTAMEVALDPAGLATKLLDGDVLRVLSMVPMYKMTVTLRGNIANRGRFSWHEGMKLSDLIPDRDALLTRDYYWRRAKLGLPTPEFQPYVSGPVPFQPTSPVDLQSPQAYQDWQMQNTVQQLPNGQYVSVIPPQNPQQGQPSNQPGTPSVVPGTTANLPGQTLSPQAPSATTSAPTTSAPGAEASAGQIQPLNPSQMASSASLGAPQTQIITQNIAVPTTKNDVKLLSPEIDWNYAVIERTDAVTLKTSLIPFNLGKLVLEHDPSQDLVLQPGDVVTIFSQADIRVPLAQQTKFIRLEGEFTNAGIYSVMPGETLRQVVMRAGGLSPEAYLYGSEFTRESTRVLQQQRIDEYVQTLELQTQRGVLSGATTAVSAQDIASSQAALVSSRELLARLHQLRATGRIVLQVKPDSAGIDSLPDLSIEDGDIFTVPPKPATVNVVGSVYDQNSFMFAQKRRVGDYLKMAGGPNRDADKKHIFIIRADGSVVSRETSSGLWGNTFESAGMSPGDTIIVPEKTFRPSGLRGFLEWSQLFSQLALGAAAISVIAP